MSTELSSHETMRPNKERQPPVIEPAADLNSLASTSAWFDRFYQVEVDDALERFSRLREKGPVVHGWGMDFGEFVFPDLWKWHDRPSAMTLTYDGACTVLQNPGVFSHSLYAAELGDENPMFQDGEDHLRFRRLVLQAFNPKAVRRWEDVANEISHELIDEFIDAGKADLVSQFTRRLPGMVFGRFIDAPMDDYEKISAWAVRQMRSFDEQGLEAVRNLGPYFASMIADRRALSGSEIADREDLTSLLVRAEINGSRFSDTAINTTLHVLVIGGTDTVFKGLANTLMFMLKQSQLREQIEADRNLIPDLNNESIRLASPNVCGAARLAIADTEIEGVAIEKGTAVLVNIPMANRDPLRWESPWEFDLRRPQRSSLAFGTGTHVCIGMHLARIVMHVGINVLLDRCSSLRLDPDAAAPRLVGLGTLYSPTLNVQFNAA